MSEIVKINKYMNVVKNNKKSADLMIMGDIVDYEWFEEDVTPQKILNELEGLGEIKELNLFVNSGGGSVEAGLAIQHILVDYKAKNNVKIIGTVSFACSIATAILMACDTIKMHKNALFMIHPASCQAEGTAEDMRKQADVLEVVTNALIQGYLPRFKGSEEELAQAVASETWYTAEEAIKWGFADELIEPLQMAGSAKGYTINNVLFERKEIVDKIKKVIETKNESEGKQKMQYSDVLLEQYGITEETFETFENVADFMQVINAKFDAMLEEKLEETKKALESQFDEAVIVTAEEVVELGEAVKKEDLLNLAKRGVLFTAELESSYDNHEKIVAENQKMRGKVIDNALKSCVRAMGAKDYNENLWRRTLNSMPYDDILVMVNSWDNVAKGLLKAGVKVSEQEQEFENKNNRPNKKENYNI